MTINDLSKQLETALSSNNIDTCVSYLKKIFEYGGGQKDAYRLLEKMRVDHPNQLEQILDVMDIVSGWCHPSQRIWAQQLFNDIFLFKVNGYDLTSGRVGLLPGVSQELVKMCNLGRLKQGDRIELRLPDGTIIQSTMAHCYIRDAKFFNEEFNTIDERIIICIPESIDTDDVPIGTEVWVTTMKAR